VYDGADALMLSGETASGSYPVDSVRMMERIILAAESAARTHGKCAGPHRRADLPASFPDVISAVACEAARTAGAVLIAAFTLSGHTARLLSHYRPAVPIVAFPRTRRCGGSSRSSGVWCRGFSSRWTAPRR
jgi:pyruvate kinase